MSITLYEDKDFQGKSLTLQQSAPNLGGVGFNDKVSSLKVQSGTWTLYTEGQFRGNYFPFTAGRYSNIAPTIGANVVSSVKLEQSEITLFQHPGFGGKSVTLTQSASSLFDHGFNDETSSLRVSSGTWIVYQHVNFTGKSFRVTAGSYDYAQIVAGIGNDTISSVKLVSFEITLYEFADERGRSLTLTEAAPDLSEFNFSDQASSVQVINGTWTLFEHPNFTGKSIQIPPSNSPILRICIAAGRMGVWNISCTAVTGSDPPSDNFGISSVRLDSGEITLYEQTGLMGRALTLTESETSLCQFDFNGDVFSVKVVGGRWTLYEESDYGGSSIQVDGSSNFDLPHGGISKISSVKLNA